MGTDRGVATAQSIAMKQMNFDSTIEEVSRKPQSLITQDDARVVQSTEVWNSPTTYIEVVLISFLNLGPCLQQTTRHRIYFRTGALHC